MEDLFIIDIKHLNLGKALTNNDLKMIREFYLLNESPFIEEEYEKILETVRSVDSRKMKKIENHLSGCLQAINIDFGYTRRIKSKSEYIKSILSFFILKAVVHQSLGFVKESKEIKGHSDSMINQAVRHTKYLMFACNVLTGSNEELSLDVDIRLLFTTLFKVLASSKVFFEKKLYKDGKSYLFYAHNLKITASQPVIFFQRFYLFTTGNTPYMHSNHFSSFFKLFKENPYSGKCFQAYDFLFLEKNMRRGYFLDRKVLKWVISEECLHYELKLETLETRYAWTVEEQARLLKEKNIEAAAKLAEKLSLYGSILRLKKILDFDTDGSVLFFPFTFDFRGRVYYLSSISVTFYKEFRYCLWGGYYDILETKPHYNNANIEKELDRHLFIVNNWKQYDFSNKPLCVRRAILWILVAIAEPFKTTFGKPKVSLREFILKGVEVAQKASAGKDALNVELEDKIKIHCLLELLQEISKDVYKKRFIFKDATASVFQHLVKVLNARNDEALKYCNLSSNDTWYDTYSYIIKSVFEDEKVVKLSPDEFKTVFSRKNLKSAIMTENYGAGLKSRLNAFFEEIKKYGIEDAEKVKEIRRLFIKFYRSLGINIVTYYPIAEIEKFFSKNKSADMILSNRNVADLQYYTVIVEQREVKYRKKRYTKKERHVTGVKDQERTKLALKANYVQALDAALVWWYLKEEGGVTVHDSFMEDWLNVTYLLSKINEGMRINFHDLGLEKKIDTSKLFSVFILL